MEVFDIQNSFEAVVGAWQALSEEDRNAKLDEFSLSFGYNSGKIENDEITYHDTREIFEKGTVSSFTGNVRTIFEIQNLKVSWEWALRELKKDFILTEDSVLHAHYLLTRGTYDEKRWEAGERPGEYKRGDYVVGVSNVGAPASEVSNLVAELGDDVNKTRSSLGARVSADKALTIAAYLHAQLVDIHPFADGNGRVARLLMNMELISSSLPPVAVLEQDRMAYYGALDAFHDERDLDPFRTFLQVELIKSWQQIIS